MAFEPETAPEDPAGDRRVAIGALTIGIVNVLKVVIQLLLLPIMARLLGPNEFGLFGLALPVIVFVILLADGGLGASLARELESAVTVWSSAFWALLLTGLVLALITTAFGFFLGYVAQQPRLPAIVAVLSLSLVFLTMSVVPIARLTRRKRIGVSAGADLVGTTVAAIIAVVLAANGAGAWSLAVQYVTLNAIRSIILNFTAFELPRFEFSFKAIKPHLITGGILVGGRMSEFAGRLVENLFVDRIFGTAILGNYTFSNQVSRFATEAAGNTVWAGLYVQALTSDRDKIVALHLQLCRLLGMILFPAAFLAAAAAPELISLMLGPEWADLSFFMRIFLPLYSLCAICMQSGPILLAYGRFEIQFWCILGFSVGRILAVLVGVWIGLVGAMYCMAFVTLLFCVAMLIWPANITGCRPLPVVLGLIPLTISSAAAAIAYLMLNSLFPASAAWTLVYLTGGLFVYVICMALIDRKNLKNDWDSARRIMMSRKAT